MKYFVVPLLGGVLLSLALAQPAAGGAISHYSAAPGLINLDDLFLPPTDAGKLVYLQYNMYYGTDTFRDAGGRKVDQITVEGPGGRPIDLDLDLEINSWTLAPGLLWSPGWELLGGKYGAVVLLPIGNPSIAGSLSSRVDRGVDLEQSSWGVGDLYVRPLWFEWNFERLDVGASYGFYAPTGKYSPGAADNVGLGFWGHEFIGRARYHIDPEKTFAAIAAVVGEINQNIEGEDLTPGAHVTINWGLRKEMFDGWFQLGILGYDTFQVSHDSGRDANTPTSEALDDVHAAGFQLGVPKLGLTVKYMHEFRAADRFEGQLVTILFVLPLDGVVDRVGGLL